MKLAVIAAGAAAAAAGVLVAVVWLAGGLGGASAPTPGVLPEGVFRYHLTEQEVLRYVPTIEQRLLKDAVGTFTWTIRDGTLSLHQTDCECTFTRVSAPYEATDKLVTVHWPARAENGVEFCASDCVEQVRWSFDGEALHMLPLATAGYDFVFWGARKPWIKID
jgi:hypothetical protein